MWKKFFKPFFLGGTLLCLLTILNFLLFKHLIQIEKASIFYRVLYYSGILISFFFSCFINYTKIEYNYDEFFRKNLLTLSFGILVFVIYHLFSSDSFSLKEYFGIVVLLYFLGVNAIIFNNFIIPKISAK